MAVVGIVAAAGSGERLGAGAPKALVRCAGRPLVEWSTDVLGQVCDRVLVAVPRAHAGERPGWVAGGATRSASVRAALAAAPDADVVVVHDGARPLVTAALVARCLEAVAREGWDGAVAAARATDTLKEARPEDGAVLRTLDRSRLWAVQTPQAFRASLLRRALAVDDARLADATDDASLVEAAGGRVRVVEAPPENLKVTRAVDLMVAEALLRARAGGA